MELLLFSLFSWTKNAYQKVFFPKIRDGAQNYCLASYAARLDSNLRESTVKTAGKQMKIWSKLEIEARKELKEIINNIVVEDMDKKDAEADIKGSLDWKGTVMTNNIVFKLLPVISSSIHLWVAHGKSNISLIFLLQ